MPTNIKCLKIFISYPGSGVSKEKNRDVDALFMQSTGVSGKRFHPGDRLFSDAPPLPKIGH